MLLARPMKWNTGAPSYQRAFSLVFREGSDLNHRKETG